MQRIIDLDSLPVDYNFVSDEERKQIFQSLQRSVEQVKTKPFQSNWNAYWGDLYEKGINAPTFFEKSSPIPGYQVFRYQKKFIKTKSQNLPELVVKQILTNLNTLFFKDLRYFVEFGSGTGHNLDYMKEINGSLKIYGSDFSTNAIKILERKGHQGFFFDMYDSGSKLPEEISRNLTKSVFFTCGALEQLGENWGQFFSFVKNNQPAYLIHTEPIKEFYDPSSEFDRFALDFHSRKGYLSGYYPAMKREFKVLEFHNEFGTLFDEGFNILVVKFGI